MYFFILGTNPTLSIAEILSVFSGRNLKYGYDYFASAEVLIMDQDIGNPADLISRLGGTIKVGEILAEIKNSDPGMIAELADSSINIGKDGGKFCFGLSAYGFDKFNAKVFGMELKRMLKERGIGARWVVSREKTLSSVVVETNKLTRGGAEFVLIKIGGKTFLGKTSAVQPFRELSHRDFGRPARDDRSGMLPPKLAQIMINLAIRRLFVETQYIASLQTNAPILLDPFCGSGTILMEAALMGNKKLIGTDLSGKAINDTKENIAWLKSKYSVNDAHIDIRQADARELSKYFKPGSVDHIATEPYLGPQRGRVDTERTVMELNSLYGAAIREFKKVLKPGGRAVMIWPIIIPGEKNPNARYKYNFLKPDIGGLKMANVIPTELRKEKFIRLTDRGTIVYGREGQKVWREIVVLEK